MNNYKSITEYNVYRFVFILCHIKVSIEGIELHPLQITDPTKSK
jgi:hypothetical protein